MNTTGSDLVAAFETVWKEIQRRHPDVPDIVATLAGDPGVYGHFAPHRWSNNDGHATHELFIGGEGLERGAVATLGTLLHEAAHGAALVRGIKDTSRQGRYHNKRFKAIANEFGIEVEQAGSIGWSQTSVPRRTVDAYAEQINLLDRAIIAHRHHGLLEVITGGGSNNGRSLECGCGRKIRCSNKVHNQGEIICGLCMTSFQ